MAEKTRFLVTHTGDKYEIKDNGMVFAQISVPVDGYVTAEIINLIQQLQPGELCDEAVHVNDQTNLRRTGGKSKK